MRIADIRGLKQGSDFFLRCPSFGFCNHADEGRCNGWVENKIVEIFNDVPNRTTLARVFQYRVCEGNKMQNINLNTNFPEIIYV